MKPLLKWVGGKTQIINTILDIFPDEIDNYYEPFLGGGSVLFSAIKSEKIKGRIYATDLNENLINFYIHLQKNCKDLIDEVEILLKCFTDISTNDIDRKPESLQAALTSRESYYYWIRQKYNNMPSSIKKSAMFLFLNKTCFRGLYREGPNGFNVPYGHYKNVFNFDKNHTRELSKMIKHVKFTFCDFEKTIKKANKNDFIYIDPPYVPVNSKSFVAYTAGGFNKVDHERLFKCIKESNSDMLMSNSDSDIIKNEFQDRCFKIETISCRRAINSKNPGSRANELLVHKNPMM